MKDAKSKALASKGGKKRSHFTKGEMERYGKKADKLVGEPDERHQWHKP